MPQTHANAYIHTDTDAHTYTHIHKQTHTQTRKHAHTHIHTDIHTHWMHNIRSKLSIIKNSSKVLALRKDSRTAERNLWRNNTYQIIIFTLVRKQQSFSDFTFGNHNFNLNLCNWFVFGMQGLFSLMAVRICEQHTLFFYEIFDMGIRLCQADAELRR